MRVAGLFEEEVLHGREKEGAKTTAFAIGLCGIFLLNQARKEFLGEIEGVFGEADVIEDVFMHGAPIRLAKGRQSGWIAVGGADHAPGSSGKPDHDPFSLRLMSALAMGSAEFHLLSVTIPEESLSTDQKACELMEGPRRDPSLQKGIYAK